MPRIVYEGPDGTREYEGAPDNITYDSQRDCWRIVRGDGGIRLVPAPRVYFYEQEETNNTVDIDDVES